MVTDDPAVSILIATRNRARRLPRLLESLELARRAAQVQVEVMVADNGSTDGTAGLLEQWSAAGPGRVRLFVEQPGKSRALNRALRLAQAPLLAFTDDDVEVTRNWITSLVAFFAERPHYDAAMGRVVVPPEVTDPAVLARVARYRGVVPLFDMGEAVCDVSDMYGCNMVVRRLVFDRVGLFNEDLGPGAAGLHDDIDLARRIRNAGMRIGYMRDAVVYHEVDPARLTDQYYRDFQLRLGRSGFEMDPKASSWRNVRRLLESAVGLAWWSLLGASSRRTRAWGRVVRHADLIWWGRQRSRERRAAGGSRSP
ncbi:MAG TPA: glycosyltransferase [Candidatus Binatia bacterium]